VWAGVDNVWEQEKLEAWKMLENAADSHTSGARFVGQPADLPEPLPKKDTTANMPKFYNELDFWQRPKLRHAKFRASALLT
jgi:hypothetical protein